MKILYVKNLIGIFLFYFIVFTSVYSQGYSEAKYKKMYETKQKRTLFLQEPYFYACITGGMGINLPTKRLFGISGDGSYFPGLESRPDNAFAYLNYGLSAGFQIKKHHVSVNYDAIRLAYATDYFVYKVNEISSSLRMNSSIPYLSLMYQYDIFGKGRLIGLQPGLHFGIGFYNYVYEKGLRKEGSNNGFVIIDSELMRMRKVGLGFGPSLNFEVNITRWFSFNFYQQLAYFPNTIFHSNITIYQEGLLKDKKEADTKLLNYSMNISLRFKMYLPKTRFKVAEKMNGL